jgi:hypothetical protein
MNNSELQEFLVCQTRWILLALLEDELGPVPEILLEVKELILGWEEVMGSSLAKKRMMRILDRCLQNQLCPCQSKERRESLEAAGGMEVEAHSSGVLATASKISVISEITPENFRPDLDPWEGVGTVSIANFYVRFRSQLVKPDSERERVPFDLEPFTPSSFTLCPNCIRRKTALPVFMAWIQVRLRRMKKRYGTPAPVKRNILHVLAEKGDVLFSHFAVIAGISPFCYQDSIHPTPFHIAAFHRNEPLLLSLLSFMRHKDLMRNFPRPESVVHSLLWNASANPNPQKIRMMLSLVVSLSKFASLNDLLYLSLPWGEKGEVEEGKENKKREEVDEDEAEEEEGEGEGEEEGEVRPTRGKRGDVLCNALVHVHSDPEISDFLLEKKIDMVLGMDWEEWNPESKKSVERLQKIQNFNNNFQTALKCADPEKILVGITGGYFQQRLFRWRDLWIEAIKMLNINSENSHRCVEILLTHEPHVMAVFDSLQNFLLKDDIMPIIRMCKFRLDELKNFALQCVRISPKSLKVLMKFGLVDHRHALPPITLYHVKLYPKEAHIELESAKYLIEGQDLSPVEWMKTFYDISWDGLSEPYLIFFLETLVGLAPALQRSGRRDFAEMASPRGALFTHLTRMYYPSEEDEKVIDFLISQISGEVWTPEFCASLSGKLRPSCLEMIAEKFGVYL